MVAVLVEKIDARWIQILEEIVYLRRVRSGVYYSKYTCIQEVSISVCLKLRNARHNAIESGSPLVVQPRTVVDSCRSIDAYRKASLYNQALAGGEEVELPADFKAPSIRGSLFGGVTLMSVGVIFLLNTRFGISMAWLHEWWPAAPILFGGYLVYKAVQEKNAEIAESAGEPKGD